MCALAGRPRRVVSAPRGAFPGPAPSPLPAPPNRRGDRAWHGALPSPRPQRVCARSHLPSCPPVPWGCREQPGGHWARGGIGEPRGTRGTPGRRVCEGAALPCSSPPRISPLHPPPLCPLAVPCALSTATAPGSPGPPTPSLGPGVGTSRPGARSFHPARVQPEAGWELACPSAQMDAQRPRGTRAGERAPCVTEAV